MKFTIKQAAIEVLKQEKCPLTIKEIYNRIIQKDLYHFKAEKPLSIVRIEVRRHCIGINFPSASPTKYFTILNDGRYWIKDVPIPIKEKNVITQESQSSDDKIIIRLKNLSGEHKVRFKNQVLTQIKQIEPENFEVFCKKLLFVYGFNKMTVTSISKDGGIDGYGKLKVGLSSLNVAFQCKRWRQSIVSRPDIDRFRGAIQGEFEQGIFFTTSKYSKEALKASIKKGAVPIILIDGLQIIDIMIEKRFGVEIENLPIYINALDSVLNEDVD